MRGRVPTRLSRGADSRDTVDELEYVVSKTLWMRQVPNVLFMVEVP